MSDRFNFTDNRLSKLPPPVGKARSYCYDSQVPCLRLQVTANGAKSFQFQMRSKKLGRVVTRSLGQYPALGVQKAREEALRLQADIADGIDIEDRARLAKQEPILDDVFASWMEIYAKPHKRSWGEDASRYDLYLRKPLGRKQISWITTERVREWHQAITRITKQRGTDGKTISPTTANRALALLSTIFSTMFSDRPNPCKGVRKFQETSRERFMSAAELQSFFAAVEDEVTSQDTRDYLLLSLFSGARRSNVLSMKWPDIDFHRGIWTISAMESKNGRPMDIPLVEQVLKILLRRKQVSNSIFVFPGTGKSGHMEEPRKGWLGVLRRAGLSGLRLHDLRRSFGSWMAIGGVNLPTIAKALGHQHHGTTAVYARLDSDPVRVAMEKGAALMEAARFLPENPFVSEDGVHD